MYYLVHIYDVYKLSFQVYRLDKVERMTKTALYNIVEDLCSFILKEVIPNEGKYHDSTSALGMPKYRELTNISGLKLSRNDY